MQDPSPACRRGLHFKLRTPAVMFYAQSTVLNIVRYWLASGRHSREMKSQQCWALPCAMQRLLHLVVRGLHAASTASLERMLPFRQLCHTSSSPMVRSCAKHRTHLNTRAVLDGGAKKKSVQDARGHTCPVSFRALGSNEPLNRREARYLQVQNNFAEYYYPHT